MTEIVPLHVTFNEDDNSWLVWFPHPLGGMDVIGEFETEPEARAFWQEQMDGADYFVV